MTTRQTMFAAAAVLLGTAALVGGCAPSETVRTTTTEQVTTQPGVPMLAPGTTVRTTTTRQTNP